MSVNLESLNDLTLFNIRVFVRLYKTTNSQAVADALQVHPSKISRTLASLRKCFGDPLFLRRQYGFDPTPLASRILPEMEALLQGSDTLAQHLQPSDKAPLRLVFCVPAALRAGLTQYLHGQCKARSSDIEVITRTWSGGIGEEMQGGKVDLGVFYATRGYPRLGSELVAENRAAYLVGNAQHEIWGKGPLSAAEVLNHPQVLLELTGFIDREKPLERAARALGMPTPPSAQVDSLTELVEMVLNSASLALICGSQAVNFLRSVQGVRVQRLPEEVRQALRSPSLGEQPAGFHLVQRPDHGAPAWLVESLRQFVREAAEVTE